MPAATGSNRRWQRHERWVAQRCGQALASGERQRTEIDASRWPEPLKHTNQPDQLALEGETRQFRRFFRKLLMSPGQQLLKVANGLLTFLEIDGIEPTNNAAERALHQSVIQRKISHGVQSRQGAICRSRLLIVTTTLRQQGRDVWQLLEQAWIAHHRGGVMPSLLPAP